MFNRRYAYDYIYDKIGRIQEARNSQTGRSETFAFDPAHNILSDKAAEGKGGNLSSGNRLKEYNGIEYTYDALGNLIYRQLPNGENQYYQYDLENQLVCAEIKKPAGNTEIWTYAYDPFGRRLSKERQDKLAWTSTDPKRTHFVWDGSRLLQEYTYKGSYTYIYTDQDSYEPLAQVFHNNQDEAQYLAYFHNDQVGIPREMTDIHGNLLWYGEYTAWGRLKKDGRVYKNAHQPFRLQNQYFDEETGLHYNLMRYYEPEAGRFVNQDPIGLWGGENLYQFAPIVQEWLDPFGLAKTPTRTLQNNWLNYVGSRHTNSDIHHGFPEEFAARFKKIADIDVNNPEYYYNLPKEKHTKKPGIHTNSSRTGKNWNKTWAGILDQVEKMNLSKTEAKKFLEKRLRALARKERISKHNAKAVKRMGKC